MKSFSIIFFVIVLVFAIIEVAYADHWKTYRDSRLGYQLRYPVDGVVTRETLASLRSAFYLDPLEPVADLINNPAFTSMVIEQKSIVKITFPYDYLIILALDRAPSKNLLPLAQPVNIGQYHFYQRHSSDAGMCHYYDYHTYFLPQGDRYYVFIFLIYTKCNEMAASSKLHSQFEVKPKYFEHILSTLQFNLPGKISKNK